MSGLLGSLHAAKTGMTVSQTSIQTASHNINNMNTPGYSRQRVEVSAKSAYSYPGYNSSMGAGQIGTGVQATDIIRIRNTFYDFQFRNENPNLGNTHVKYDHYTGIETIFNEPSETSIASSIANFFSSWQELIKTPTDVGSKDIVLQNSKYLADKISSIKVRLDDMRQQVEYKLNDDINQVNDMLSKISELDKQILIIQGSGKTPNDLMDSRDKLLDELSSKLNLNDTGIQSKLSDGKLELGDLINTDPNTGKPILNTNGGIQILTGINPSGEIQGSLDMINKINEYTISLKELAAGISDNVNEKLFGAPGEDGHIEGGLFKLDLEGEPIIELIDGLRENPESWEIYTSIATAIYQLKETKIPFGLGAPPTPPTDTTTIEKFYSNIIQKLGNETQEVIRNEQNQSQILLGIDNARLNVSGVSLDEEMVNLIQFQHAYNASAKVISTIDSLLNVVVNGLIK